MPVLKADKTSSVRTDLPKPIVGLVRFSLVLRHANYFPRLKGVSFEERVAQVFESSRLERRFELFESICLPSLTSQSDQGFNVAVLTSKFLPDWAMERLRDSLSGIKNVYVRPFRPNANYMNIARRAVFELLDHHAPVYASFNLDDDDALASDYVARVRSYLTKENIGKALTFQNGYELTISGGDLRLRRDRRPKASAGLVGINAGPIGDVADVVSIFEYGGHRNVDARVPLITDTTEDMYVQSANGANVSLRTGQEIQETVLMSSEIAAQLAPKFPYLTAEVIEALNRSV